MSKEQYKFPMVDNEYYEKKYSGIENSLIYDEQKDKETIRKYLSKAYSSYYLRI